ncbi:MAG: metal ABC transporter permease [Chloroflexia bacterium]|nr:metal ABC transporter permease [Chloroflexia bacterium]
MSAPVIEIQLIAVVVAVACALPGVFLVLRRMALMSDAISHAILLGIVLAFFVVEDLASPWLLIAASATGLLTVGLVELLHRSRLVREDAAIGLVFPLLFSLGVILISRYAGNVHLDTDAVLLGELAFAPFDRLVLGGYDLGPKSLYLMGAIALLNLLFILLFYKELKLATFDAGLAAALGFAPTLMHYGLMGLVSVTAVGAFDAVGSVLVVALMIAPPAAAYLLTDRLSTMLALSAGGAALSALGGFWLAMWLDASIAGSMATTAGLLFGLVLLLAPERGLLAQAHRRSRQRWQFAQHMLAIHLFNHEGLPESVEESRIEHMHEHMRWDPAFAGRVIGMARRAGLVRQQDGHLALTEKGRQRARETVVQS